MDLHGHAMPATLRKLLDFDAATSRHAYYTAGLELDPDNDPSGITCGGKFPEMPKHFISFADADPLNSLYAFWLRDGNKDLEQAPITFMGSAGDCAVVAENIRDLLQLLSCDVTPMPWEDSYLCYYKDEEDEPSPGIARYRGWVKEHMGLKLMDHEEAEAYSKAINLKYGQEFKALLSQLTS